ncbi:T9SS type A sorting domain-containing protein [Pedobacter sp. UBA4863]|uniref:T9SS type A sorting domain-containing protein n=1 Tax=Pedobacter sp. UBA4863 TaxID=1947060 RepID=UPI0025CDDE9B|nr:T9SS type A sorting domain-containing protein [Pedobacter sp. UBA4863]
MTLKFTKTFIIALVGLSTTSYAQTTPTYPSIEVKNDDKALIPTIPNGLTEAQINTTKNFNHVKTNGSVFAFTSIGHQISGNNPRGAIGIMKKDANGNQSLTTFPYNNVFGGTQTDFTAYTLGDALDFNADKAIVSSLRNNDKYYGRVAVITFSNLDNFSAPTISKKIEISNAFIQGVTHTQASIPANSQKYGSAVAIYGDFVVIAGENYTNDGITRKGRVFLLKLNAAGAAYELITELLPDASITDGIFGKAVKIHGNTILVGHTRSTAKGLVYAYFINAAGNGVVSSTPSTTVSNTSSTTNGDMFGSAIDMSGDYVVVGAPKANGLGPKTTQQGGNLTQREIGLADIYKFNSEAKTFAHIGVSRTENSDNRYPNLGGAVSINSNGVVMLGASPNSQQQSGYGYIGYPAVENNQIIYKTYQYSPGMNNTLNNVGVGVAINNNNEFMISDVNHGKFMNMNGSWSTYLPGAALFGKFLYDTEAIRVLPVTLKSFTVKAENKQTVLMWNTATEVNAKSFVVQHSVDGKNFNTLAEIDAKNKNASSYVFRHQKPAKGLNYYQLLQTDNDGVINYLDVKSISFNLNNAEASLYPNPTNGNVIVEFAAQQFIKANLIDLNGKTLNTYILQPNQNNLSIDLAQQPNGMYFIKLLGSLNTKTLPIIKK